jgi:hypothetical protein
VSGKAAEALAKTPAGTSFKPAFDARMSITENRRAAMAKRGLRYTAHSTELTIESSDIGESKATQRGTEHVVLQLAGGGPSETEYEEEHVFEFARDGDTWTLVSDTIMIPEALPEENRRPVDAAPLREAPPGYQPDRARRRTNQGGPTTAMGTGEPTVVYASRGPGMDIQLAQTWSYNAQTAVSYALQYWSNYNSQYRSYSNDCTNFTSQALRAGGWTFDESGSRTGPDTWYYGSFTATTSYSWAGAHNFYQFFKQSGRGFMADYFSDLIKGDIVQADWGPTPDGNISHSMIVTDVSNGTAFLTYHSSNTRNRSLDDIKAQNPGTKWYGLLMYP